MKITPTTIILIAAIGLALSAGIYHYQMQQERMPYETELENPAWLFPVADTGSMEPTLNGNSTLFVVAIRGRDVKDGMILIADHNGLPIVKRYHARGHALRGDNRANTLDVPFDPLNLRGFVQRYSTDGIEYLWTGEEYQKL